MARKAARSSFPSVLRALCSHFATSETRRALPRLNMVTLTRFASLTIAVDPAIARSPSMPQALERHDFQTNHETTKQLLAPLARGAQQQCASPKPAQQSTLALRQQPSADAPRASAAHKAQRAPSAATAIDKKATVSMQPLTVRARARVVSLNDRCFSLAHHRAPSRVRPPRPTLGTASVHRRHTARAPTPPPRPRRTPRWPRTLVCPTSVMRAAR